MSRGMVNKQITELAKKLLNIDDITTTQLRLMPYLMYVSMNEQYIDQRKINNDERDILSKWQDDGHIVDIEPTLKFSKTFWDSMCEIIWTSYVAVTDR